MEQFIHDVAAMRSAQKQFFQWKSKVNLRKAQRLETIVDKKLKGLQRPGEIPTVTIGELFKSDNL